MSATPSQPGTAVIQLPPGLDLDQYLTLEGQLVTLAISTAVVFGIVIWDYFVLLPDEIALYRVKERHLWRTPTTWAFVILRYSGILATLPSLFFTSVQSQHCQVAVVLSQVGAIGVVASSGLIFCYRVIAIWKGNKLVYALVSFVFLIMIGCWIAVGTQFNASTGPPTPFGSNCEMHDIVSWAPISFASSVAFDTAVLLTTLAKTRPTLQTTKSCVTRQVFRDTLVYFLITAATNIVVFSIQALGSERAMLKTFVVPYSTLVTVTMGSRVFLNLRLLDSRRRQELGLGVGLGRPSVMPLSSHGTCSSSSATDRSRGKENKGSAGMMSVFPSARVSCQSLPDSGNGPYVAAFPTPPKQYSQTTHSTLPSKPAREDV